MSDSPANTATHSHMTATHITATPSTVQPLQRKLTLWEQVAIFLKGGRTKRKTALLARYNKVVSAHSVTRRQLDHERACLTAYEAKLHLARKRRGSNSPSGIPSGLL
jgi:hypothetical protein